jgi:hypothetical protein
VCVRDKERELLTCNKGVGLFGVAINTEEPSSFTLSSSDFF